MKATRKPTEFKEVNEANQVLTTKRSASSTIPNGSALSTVRQAEGFNQVADSRAFEGFDGFSDIFESFFAEAEGPVLQRPQRGADIRVKLV
jgi:DnaJ-class molecular chaperone